VSIIVKQMVRSESFIVKTQAVLNCLGLLSCRNSRIALGYCPAATQEFPWVLVLPSLLFWNVFTAITTMVNYWFYTFICTMLNSITMPLKSSNFLPKQKVYFFFIFLFEFPSQNTYMTLRNQWLRSWNNGWFEGSAHLRQWVVLLRGSLQHKAHIIQLAGLSARPTIHTSHMT